jgi:CheY-like chemotaxis protein
MPHILLVDDDPDGLAVRRALLEHAGYAVESAGNCEAARAAFDVHPPAVIVMDLRLPETADGLALIRHFRAARPETRIIVFSGAADDLRGLPESAMVDGLMRKPARSERLLGLISKLA